MNWRGGGGEPPDLDSFDIIGEHPILERWQRERLEQNRPVVRPITRTEIQPVGFSVRGKRGERTTVEHRSYQLFKPTDFFATDTSPTHGRATGVTMFVGILRQFDRVPSWMFSEWMSDDERKVCEDAVKLLGTCEETDSVREAARRLKMADAVRAATWATWQPGLQVRFQIDFAEDCEWQAVAWGKTLR